MVESLGSSDQKKAPDGYRLQSLLQIMWLEMKNESPAD